MGCNHLRAQCNWIRVRTSGVVHTKGINLSSDRVAASHLLIEITKDNKDFILINMMDHPL